jgi:hypothetical protein
MLRGWGSLRRRAGNKRKAAPVDEMDSDDEALMVRAARRCVRLRRLTPTTGGRGVLREAGVRQAEQEAKQGGTQQRKRERIGAGGLALCVKSLLHARGAQEKYAPKQSLLAEEDPDIVEDGARRGATKGILNNRVRASPAVQSSV